MSAKKKAATKKKAVVTPAKKKAAPAAKAKKAAPSEPPPRALAKLYEGLGTKVFETVFKGDAPLIKAFLAWGKAKHPRWYAEIDGDHTPEGTRAVILETLLVDEVDDAAPVAFFAGLPTAKRRAAVAAMKAADEDEGDDDDGRASTPGAVTIAGVTWLPGDTTLHLVGSGLTQLPDEIGQCTSLTKLFLSSNQLTSLPAAMSNLTKLDTLDLAYSRLAALPRWLGDLPLTTVNVVDNPLPAAELAWLAGILKK